MKYKKFVIKYEFINSVWTNESITIEAQTKEQAIEKCKKELCMAYGSAILKEVKIIQ